MRELVLRDVIARAQEKRLVDLLDARRDQGVPWSQRRPGARLHGTEPQLPHLGRVLALRRDAAARVVQARAEDRFQIQIHEHQVLLEGTRLREEVSLGTIDPAVSVEDQLVLPPDRVHEGHDRDAVERARREHAVARGRFPRVKGRGGEIDHQLRVAIDRHRRGRARRREDVLADVHAERQRSALAHEGFVPGAEVADLVEDAVIRQMALLVNSRDLAVVRDGRGVVHVARALRESDDGGDA